MTRRNIGAVPSSPHSEGFVLGCVLRDGALLPDLPEGAFHQEVNRLVFRAMRSLAIRREPVTIITTAEELARAGMLEAIGGPLALRDLQGAVGTTVGLAQSVAELDAFHRARRAIEIGTQLATEGYACADASEFAERAAKLMAGGASEMRSSRDLPGLVPMSDLLQAELEGLQARANGQVAKLFGIGLRDVDALLGGGFEPTDLVIIAARPAMGKSAFAMAILIGAARTGGLAALFCFEMSSSQLVRRAWSGEAGVGMQWIKRPTDEDVTMYRALEGMARLSEYAPRMLILKTATARTVEAICDESRRAHDRSPLSAVMVDYVQLVQPTDRRAPREQQVAHVSRTLKALAMELQVPVFGLAQVNRDLEKRPGDKRPMLSDLRESGAIEADADVVLGLYRDEYYNPNSDARGTAEVIVLKQRNGPTGTAHCAFLGETAAFRDLERHRIHGPPWTQEPAR